MGGSQGVHSGLLLQGQCCNLWLGGAIYVYGWPNQVANFIMYDSTFVENNGTQTAHGAQIAGITDTGECGGVLLSSCRCIGISNAVFANNTGTGLCVYGHDASLGHCEGNFPVLLNRSISAGAYTKDYINNFLGPFHTMDMGLNIQNSVFLNNTAAALSRCGPDYIQPVDPLAGGAGLDMKHTQFSVLSNLTFAGNHGLQGSGMHLDSCFATVVWNSTFHNNSATAEGGGIATVSSHGPGLLLGNSTLSNNLAVSGGAVYGDSGASVTISNSTQIVSNQAITDGGAVFCDACNVLSVVAGSSMGSNQAGGVGGGCYCSSCVLLRVQQSYLTNNRCDLLWLQSASSASASV